MRKVNRPHRITVRISDDELEFLNSLQKANSEIIRRGLRLYMYQIARIRRLLR